ncbi:HNH endonuclease [Tropicimonas isoalkanivorans]|uniref:HNH endonuclease signature motif containing protein n=1 Tax=Tropicimonas isoalkanivorans TaxID=441112 RepID=UPI000B872D2F|nr:HNH endonuclease [Tropicimonas isoalkanivorans]
MPSKPPRICACGHRVAAGVRCPCERKRAAERNARHDRKRPNSSQRGYTGTWEKARLAFLAEHPRCRRCGGPADLVDHITPHKGDPARFWDRTNWQALCTHCHSGAKQREERRLTRRPKQ